MAVARSRLLDRKAVEQPSLCVVRADHFRLYHALAIDFGRLPWLDDRRPVDAAIGIALHRPNLTKRPAERVNLVSEHTAIDAAGEDAYIETKLMPIRTTDDMLPQLLKAVRISRTAENLVVDGPR